MKTLTRVVITIETLAGDFPAQSVVISSTGVVNRPYIELTQLEADKLSYKIVNFITAQEELND